MTDENKILSIETLGDGDLERYTLTDKTTKSKAGEALVTEGNNGKFHGQKGHSKAYLAFELDNDGKLTNISVTVPSSGETFLFF